MPFKKGDPNINRKGRPKNAEPELLRAALAKQGAKRGQDFWDKVAEYAYTDKNVMIAVIKKFIPDMTSNEVFGSLTFNKTPDILLEDKPLEYDVGSRITGYTEEATETPD